MGVSSLAIAPVLENDPSKMPVRNPNSTRDWRIIFISFSGTDRNSYTCFLVSETDANLTMRPAIYDFTTDGDAFCYAELTRGFVLSSAEANNREPFGTHIKAEFFGNDVCTAFAVFNPGAIPFQGRMVSPPYPALERGFIHLMVSGQRRSLHRNTACTGPLTSKHHPSAAASPPEGGQMLSTQ